MGTTENRILAQRDFTNDLPERLKTLTPPVIRTELTPEAWVSPTVALDIQLIKEEGCYFKSLAVILLANRLQHAVTAEFGDLINQGSESEPIMTTILTVHWKSQENTDQAKTDKNQKWEISALGRFIEIS